MMKDTVAFHIAVHEVRQRDPRYAPHAYAFLCDALDHAVKLLNREDADDRHVTGQELLVGFRALALDEFGPMANFVMQEWGIKSSEDVGCMVYNFIEVGFYGKNDTDSIEDFSDGVNMKEALNAPYALKGKRKGTSNAER
jgi:uncharacterized repeat protein (TIGR04138 family)